VPQRDDDRSDQRETVRALVSDQDPEMLGLAIMRGPAHAQIVSNPDAVGRSGQGIRKPVASASLASCAQADPLKTGRSQECSLAAGWSIGENGTIGVLDTVTIGSLRLERFEAVLAPERYDLAVSQELGIRSLAGLRGGCADRHKRVA
jgi:hypothetical protein